MPDGSGYVDLMRWRLHAEEAPAGEEAASWPPEDKAPRKNTRLPLTSREGDRDPAGNAAKKPKRLETPF